MVTDETDRADAGKECDAAGLGNRRDRVADYIERGELGGAEIRRRTGCGKRILHLDATREIVEIPAGILVETR